MSRPSEVNPLTTIAKSVNHDDLDLYQPRDWPHRQGDQIRFNIVSMPLYEDSPGRRSHPCDSCGDPCLCIHDNVKCWKCKGAFCGSRCFPPTSLLATPMKTIVKSGFGKCPVCQEPLRSMALIDVFRQMMESMSASDNTTVLPGGMVAFGKSEHMDKRNLVFHEQSSLVQEAEEALDRARTFQSDNNTEAAILEYTHAINAINYYASSSGDLVLRPHDILLIAHPSRAKLENNAQLMDAILAAYPRAFVKDTKSDEPTWYISKSGFESLFYPLPACLLVGAPSAPNGLVRTDLRSESKDRALTSPDVAKQLRLCGSQGLSQAEVETHPHCDGVDSNFASLNGTWKGNMNYTTPLTSRGFARGHPSIQVNEEQLKLVCFIQFVHVFPSATAASEYTRILFETKSIGEENPPTNATDCPRIAKLVKELVGSLGPEDMELHKVRAIQSVVVGPAMMSVIAAVGNASTKIFISHVPGSEKAACTLAARAIVYLNEKLLSFRTMEQSDSTPHFQTADMTVCAYCGGTADELKRCTRCKSARYCTYWQRSHVGTRLIELALSNSLEHLSLL